MFYSHRAGYLITVDLFKYLDRQLDEEEMMADVRSILDLFRVLDCLPLAMGVDQGRYLVLACKDSDTLSRYKQLFATKTALSRAALDKYERDHARARAADPTEPDDVPF